MLSRDASTMFLVRDVDDAHEDVVAAGDDAGLEDVLERKRHGDNGQQRHEHAEALEGEQLQLLVLVVPGVLDQRVQVHGWLTASQAEEQTHDVPGQRSVRVGVLRVDDADKLREDDDVDEVGAEEPQFVDGGDGESGGQSHGADPENGRPHHPDDLHF